MSGILAHPIPGGALLLMLASPLILVVNLLAYVGFAAWLIARHPVADSGPWFIGATRTIVAVMSGHSAVSSLLLGPWVAHMPFSFAVPMIPVRAVEWAVLLWIFFGRRLAPGRLGGLAAHAVLAVVLSFVLDLGLAYWYQLSSMLGRLLSIL